MSWRGWLPRWRGFSGRERLPAERLPRRHRVSCSAFPRRNGISRRGAVISRWSVRPAAFAVLLRGGPGLARTTHGLGLGRMGWVWGWTWAWAWAGRIGVAAESRIRTDWVRPVVATAYYAPRYDPYGLSYDVLSPADPSACRLVARLSIPGQPEHEYFRRPRGARPTYRNGSPPAAHTERFRAPSSDPSPRPPLLWVITPHGPARRRFVRPLRSLYAAPRAKC